MTPLLYIRERKAAKTATSASSRRLWPHAYKTELRVVPHTPTERALGLLEKFGEPALITKRSSEAG